MPVCKEGNAVGVDEHMKMAPHLTNHCHTQTLEHSMRHGSLRTLHGPALGFVFSLLESQCEKEQIIEK